MVITGFAGFAGAMATVVKKVDKLREDFDTHVVLAKDQKKILEDMIEGVKKSIREELERSQRGSKEDLDQGRSRFVELERRIERLADEHKHFLRREDFKSFVDDEGSRWDDLQRSLGRIEGSLNLEPPRPPPQNPKRRG